MKYKTGSVGLSVAIFFVLLLFCGPLFAETPSNFSPLSTDISMTVLKQIIGDWESSKGANSVTPLLGGAMKIFNAGVLVFATAIFAYAAIVGTLQSAHDGQLLGKQWSTVWVPIRFSAGIALLIPTASGLCLAQYGLLWMLGSGVGLASTMTYSAASSYVDRMSNTVAVKMTNGPAVQEAMTAILANELCVEAFNKKYGVDEGSKPKFGLSVVKGGNVTVPNSSSYFSKSNTAYGAMLQWGALPGSNVSESGNICGSSPYLAEKPGWLSSGDSEFELLSKNAQANAAIMASSWLNTLAYNAMYYGGEKKLQFISKSEVEAALDKAGKYYQMKIEGLIDENIGKQTDQFTKDVLKTAKDGGWFTLGTWYFQFNRLNGKLSENANAVPPVNGYKKLDIESGDASLKGIEDHDATTIASILKIADEYFKRQPLPTNRLISESKVGAGGSMSSSWIGRMVDNASNEMFGVGSETTTSGVLDMADTALIVGYNPLSTAPGIVQLKNLGDSLLNGVWTVVGISAASVVAETKLSVAKGVADKIFKWGEDKPLTTAAGTFISTLATSAAMMLVVIGIIFAFWLPMLPFINWVGGMVGWVISVLEMLVAAPVWIAAHLHPEGEGMASRHAASGYMIVLELLLRPVLMVFGFIVAVIIVDPLLNVISWMYFPAFSSATADAVSGPITFVMKIIIYVVICWTVVNFSFKAITSVPAGVMKWIGGMAGHNSEMAEGVGENSRMAVVAGIHQTQGAFRAAGGAARQYASKYREGLMNKEGGKK